MSEGRVRTAIVTGAASGIGAAIALLLAEKRWNIVINTARSADAAEAVAKQCRDLGAKAIVVLGDVSVDDDCRRIAREAEAAFGGIDALVNNAAVTRFCPLDDLEGVSAQDFLNMAAVNVVGPFQMTRACAPVLRASPGAAIVNVTSNAGITGMGSSAPYAASKGAMNTLTLSLARALAPKVRVNAVAPGFTLTPWHTKGVTSDRLEHLTSFYENTNPLRRNTTAQDVALAVYSFIDGSPAITGQVLLVDSGDHLHTNIAPK